MRRFVNPIRVAHIDEDPAYREAVAQVLARSIYPKFALSQFANLQEFKEKVSEKKPEVIIYDIKDVTHFTEELFTTAFLSLGRIPLILVTLPVGDAEVDIDFAYDAIQAGADNVFDKLRHPVDTWPKYIVRAVARGQRVSPAEICLADAFSAIDKFHAGVQALQES